MIKIIDTDKLFSDFASSYIEKNMQGLSPKEIEDRIEELFNAFADTPLDALNGKTPNTYYNDFDVLDLIRALKRHVDTGVEPPVYLVDAIVNKDGGEDKLIELLASDKEDLIIYAMNILSEKNCVKAVDKFFDFIVWDYDETVTELATEFLSVYPDEIAERAIETYKDIKKQKRVYLLEILSRVTKKDNRIFEILVNEFILNPDNIPLYANYISRYGDERALPILLTCIESDKIDYTDFQELKCAIEALGGECNIKKDFSNDRAYLALKKAKENSKIN
jgi:hypothetical protein